MSRRRYPGTGPFGPEDAALFFGRKRETEELYLRILSVPLLLQFGKSGLGKTSLLQAGLFPLLRAKPFLPVMIRLNDPRESLTDAVARSIRESVTNEGVDVGDTSGGLWELLATTTAWREDLLLTPVLVFDQFEEVFTIHDKTFRVELAAELGRLATGTPPERWRGAQLASEAPVDRPDVKLLISLKETHLGALEQFSARIPGLFHERLRLEPLSESDAADAVVNPAKLEAKEGETPYWTKPFTYDDYVLDGMLNYLKGRSDVIEPFQLQLLCRHAEGIAQRKESTQTEPVTLTMDDFKGSDAFAAVLANFYRDVLSRISSPAERKRAAELCEDGLLGTSGQRLMLEKAQILSDYGVSESTLDVLGRERLIREERRMESTFYELSHDRLAESVFAARSEKLPKSVRRALWTSGAVALLIVTLLIIGFLLGWNNTVQKERDSAENLLGFLLGEQFLGEVRDVGRSTLLRQVQEQVDRRGVGLRSALNRGLSLRNRAEIMRTEGQLAEAVSLFRESLKAFENARDNPDAPRELARTNDRLGIALVSQGKLTEALPYSEAADKYWGIVANTPGTSDVVRSDCTSLADSIVTTVELKTRMGDSASALADLERTFTILEELLFGRGQASPQCGPMMEQAAPYPDPSVMQALTQAALARAVLFSSFEDHEGAAALAEQARLLRPSSISARTTALMTLKWRGLVQKSPEAALSDFRRVLAESDELRRSDPDDRLWQRERAASQLLVSKGIVRCNEVRGSCRTNPSLDDAEALVLEAIATFRALAAADPTNASLQDDLVSAWQARSAILAARGGQAAERLFVIRAAQRVHDQAMRDRNDARGEQLAVDLLGEEADVLVELGRLPEARETFRRAIDRATKLVAAHPDNALYFITLAFMSEREAALLREAGDPKGADAAHEEAVRATTRFNDLSHKHVAASAGLRNRGAVHVAKGELVAAESAFRDAARLRPASYVTYDDLRDVYDRLQRSDEKLGRKEERVAALSASMHAAQLAVWLAPESAQSAMNNELLEARNVFAQALIAENDRTSNEAALGLMQEAVVVADSLVQREPDNPDYRFSLADAKCGLGKVRRGLNAAGWENAIRSGLIDAQRAATLAPRRVFFRTKQASWRQYLGEELAKNEGEKERAAAELALALQGYEEAARLDPKNAEARDGIRNVRALIGEMEHERRDDK